LLKICLSSLPGRQRLVGTVAVQTLESFDQTEVEQNGKAEIKLTRKCCIHLKAKIRTIASSIGSSGKK